MCMPYDVLATCPGGILYHAFSLCVVEIGTSEAVVYKVGKVMDRLSLQIDTLPVKSLDTITLIWIRKCAQTFNW